MPDLRRFLEETFEEKGGEMPFEDFMSLALYDPIFGYYAVNIEGVGDGRGDFATSATLSSGLGRAIGAWLKQEQAHWGWSDLPMIEVGAGSGALAAEILGTAGWWERRKWRYHIVEISPALRTLQKKRLGRRVSWFESIEEALHVCGGRALVFSNELIDAFPAIWLRWSDEVKSFEEIWVRYSAENGLREVFKEFPDWLDENDFSAMQFAPRRDGQRIEIQPAVKAWISEVSSGLTNGSMLTIDYGGEPADLYRTKRNGTLRGYFRNARIEEGAIYRRFGKQDLTLDVNFQDLRNWGEDAGFKTISYESQRSFFARMGMGEDLMATSDAGEAFRVLHQRR